MEVYGILIPRISRFENTGIVKVTVTHCCPIHFIWEKCQVLFCEGVRCAALTSVQSIYKLHSKYNQQH